MRYRKKQNTKKLTERQKIIEGGIKLGIIVGILILWASENIFFSLIPVFVFPLILAFQKNTPEENMQPKNILPTKKKHIRSLKRRERVQQQLKTIVIEPQKKTSKEKEEKLLPLLEVDRIQ